MKLHVSLDDNLIKKYVERGSSPVFTIYWTQNGAAYPEAQWLDFGSVVLSWWLVAAKSLVEGASEADLPFMDGPFCLKARLLGNHLHVSADGQSWQWQTPRENFVLELLRAADQVQQKFDEWGVPDNEGLRVGIQQLKNAESQTNTRVPGNRSAVTELVSH